MGYEEQFEQDDLNKISKLNSGGLINLRLDTLWKDAHKHSRAGKYSNWNADLDCIWSELGGEYDETSQEIKEFDELNFKLNSVKNWSTIFGFKKLTNNELFDKAKQYFWLRKKEMFLRRIQNKQGKGTAYQSEDDEYMD